MRPATTEADPLDDRPRGPCPDCEGVGWRRVLPEYAARMFPMPEATLEHPVDQATLEMLQALVQERREAAEATSYPCRTCRPSQFYRWAGGHYSPDHPDWCPQCLALRRGKTPPPDEAMPGLPYRADTDR